MISRTPSAASSSTSRTMSPMRRLTSGPRTIGTMQKVHELSQPIWMVTHAEWPWSRRAGSADGYASCSSRISTTGPSSRARSSSAAALARLWVPNTTSTWPARSTISSRSFWARQPPTAIWRSGRSCLQRLQAAEVAVELVVGVLADAARVEHDDVGRRRASSVGSMPSAASSPAMRSESCSFIWHPKVRTWKRRGSAAGCWGWFTGDQSTERPARPRPAAQSNTLRSERSSDLALRRA